jgi:hypothetical protein
MKRVLRHVTPVHISEEQLVEGMNAALTYPGVSNAWTMPIKGRIDMLTEMLKIMAVCDTHKVGIVPHFTGPIATAGHMHTMMAFPGQVLMEYNQGERPVPYMPEFLDCKNGKVWPNDRPGLGVSVDEKQLTFIEAMTEAAPAPTHRRPDGSLTHW